MKKNNVHNDSTLEGLIKVNLLFSIAIFISIIFLLSSLQNPSSSEASDTNVAEKLLVDLLNSFKYFLGSWLAAQAMKLTNKRYGIEYIASCSFAGFFILMISMMQHTGAKFELLPSSCPKSVVGCTVTIASISGLLFYGVAFGNIFFRSRDDIPDE